MPDTPRPRDGAAQFEDVGRAPTLDLVMQKDPRDITDDDLDALIRAARLERAFRCNATKKAQLVEDAE